MNNTDYRQFMDEVYFWGKQKQFSGIFSKANKMFNYNADPKLQLLDKRKAYDFGIANLFKKYRVDYNSLYNDLDELWEETEKFGRIEKLLLVLPLSFAGNLVELQYVFNSYIKKTIEYCKKVAKGCINE